MINEESSRAYSYNTYEYAQSPTDASSDMHSYSESGTSPVRTRPTTASDTWLQGDSNELDALLDTMGEGPGEEAHGRPLISYHPGTGLEGYLPASRSVSPRDSCSQTGATAVQNYIGDASQYGAHGDTYATMGAQQPLQCLLHNPAGPGGDRTVLEPPFSTHSEIALSMVSSTALIGTGEQFTAYSDDSTLDAGYEQGSVSYQGYSPDTPIHDVPSSDYQQSSSYVRHDVGYDQHHRYGLSSNHEYSSTSHQPQVQDDYGEGSQHQPYNYRVMSQSGSSGKPKSNKKGGNRRKR
ncbi:hypothetical protein F503_04332 [Ophiostoma piceae UAMH 11346]|uniref:Uncharacterized protein n=1 Tax=Ophiostoma piceae (strain UAMH 11346) TaxID=1262450 RepID=S3D5T5_OPHP1|nr:hypothetical protein F503_04332 [Ophiostoma piceae UAMH 11346]